MKGEELAVGATDAFTSSDAAPVPDTYTMDEHLNSLWELLLNLLRN